MTWTRPPIDPAIYHECTRISRWKSLALCVGVYLAVIGLAYAGGPLTQWWGAVPALILIAGLQMHLLILLHEGAHLGLHPDWRLNDLIADVFCAMPLFLLGKNYRVMHLTHHKYSGQPERDPEARIYAGQGYFYARRRGSKAIKMLLCDLVGINALKFAHDFGVWIQEQQRAGRVRGFSTRDGLLYLLVWGVPVALAVKLGFWHQLLVFWVLPQLTLTYFFLKIHGYGEHTGASGPTEFERTWVHATHPVEDFFFAPIYSGYHLEHHLFPRVPWYHMAQFRRHLTDIPEFREKAERVTVTSYLLGRRSVLQAMIWGEGEYRVSELGAQTAEIRSDDVVSADCKAEVDEQMQALTPKAADPLPFPNSDQQGRQVG